jgi:hypothetical protein
MTNAESARRVLGSSVLAEIFSSQKIRDRESAIINTRGGALRSSVRS